MSRQLAIDGIEHARAGSGLDQLFLVVGQRLEKLAKFVHLGLGQSAGRVLFTKFANPHPGPLLKRTCEQSASCGGGLRRFLCGGDATFG